jgi:fructose-1,6-bisphosphatase/inositol monophosphatase family enzyme
VADVDPEELLALAVGVATDAADLLAEGLERARVVLRTKSSRTDLVTDYDGRSERLIVDGILAARPADGVLGEEGTERPGESGVRWIIDPLDGTTNYLYGYPGFAVSIAVEHRGEVVAGVVYDVARRECFTATLGGGAHLDGVALAVNVDPDLSTALVGTGFSYDAERRRRQAEVVTAILPVVRDLRRGGAAAIDLCSVAAGRLDAFYERGLQVWDYAAGALVASEAGAWVGDLHGGPPSSAFALAAGPPLFEPLRLLLDGAGASDA